MGKSPNGLFDLAPKDAARPFRVWNTKTRKHMVGRNYKNARRALDGAMLLVRWAEINTTLDVYDATTGRLIGQYSRKPLSITFTRVSE